MKTKIFPYVGDYQIIDPIKFYKRMPAKWIAKHAWLNKEYIETNMGPIKKAIQGPHDEKVYTGVLVVSPTPERQYYTLVTSGMSVLPMSYDPQDHCQAHLRAEVYMHLPLSWKLDKESLATPEWGWPVAWLLYTAKFPHIYRVKVEWGSAIELSGSPDGVMGDSNFTGCLILTSLKHSAGVDMPDIDPLLPINYYNLYPAYKEEIEDALKLGSYCSESVIRLQKLLIANEMNGPLDIKRKNVITNENH